MADNTIRVRITGDSQNLSNALDSVGVKAEEIFGKKLGGIVTKGLSKIPLATTVAAAGLAAVGSMAGSAIGRITEMSDRYALISSRIGIMNDGMHTNKQLLDMVYNSANRARGSYHDMADTVTKLGILAKEAFSSNEEMIFFAEQLNKQFKIGGASIQEQTAGMYQLTQAMASGRLQGDEFRSIMENAPILAQAIAKELDVPMGKLRDLSSQGVITAEVIKNALKNTAEETNEQFEKIPMTFQDSMQILSNTANKAFEPVFELLESMTQSDAFGAVFQSLQATIQGFAAASYVAIQGVALLFKTASAAITTSVNLIKSAFSALPAVMAVATSALVGYTAYTAVASLNITTLTVKTALLAAKEKVLSGLQIARKAIMSALCAASIAYNSIMTLTITRETILNGLTKVFTALTSIATIKTYAQAAAQAVLNAIMYANPIGIIIGLLAALAAAFAASSIASNGLKATLSSVWSSIVHTTTWAINGIISLINKLIGAINKVGAKLGEVFKFDYSGLSEIEEISADTAQEFVNATEAVAGSMADAITGGGEVAVPDMGGDIGGASGGGGSPRSGGGGAGSADTAINEAKRLHESLKDEWSEMFKTKSQLAERWRDKELEELEKSKANNLNYEDDRQMIMEMYAKKREQALSEEMAKTRELENKVRNLANEYKKAMTPTDSEGNVKPLDDLITKHESTVNEIRDKWAALSEDYAQMSQHDQEIFINALKSRGVIYELDANNRISFEKTANDEILAEREKFNQALELNTLTQADKEFEIKEAMRTQNFEALQLALDEDYVMHKDNYELKKALMEDYAQAVQDSYFNIQEMIYNVQQQGFGQFSKSISEFLQGTMSLQKAFQNLGKTILKTLTDYVANWIASRLKLAIFGKQAEAKDAASSNASAASQLPLVRELALQKSLASWGASATAGLAAYQNASMVGKLALSAFANGGMVDSPTLALIGEGKYKEAVVPFNEKTFQAIGEGVANNGGGGSVTLNVTTMDSESFAEFMERKGLDVIKQKLFETNQGFASESGVW